jgi:aldose 1-epimerase
MKDAVFITLSNNQTTVCLTNYGARVVSIVTPDKQGKLQDVIIGPGTISDFLNCTHSYYGATIGRYANRITNGKFKLNGVTYQLACNIGKDHLHGGEKGLQRHLWQIKNCNSEEVTMFCISPDGEDGYPGELHVEVMFQLHHNGTLSITYKATASKATILNITNHAFFNLNGGGTIVNHKLQIFADAYTPVNELVIPTGVFEAVHETPFDFRIAKTIGRDIEQPHEQLIYGSGYDHNYILKKENNRQLLKAATVCGNDSGICMDVFTTEPGMQLYTGNFMDGSNRMKYDTRDEQRTAFCLETQHFPDTPNHTNFPSVVLHPGTEFFSQTNYKFYLTT